METAVEEKVKGLTRDELLAKATILKTIAVKLVDIGVVYLREMMGKERGRFEMLVVTVRGKSSEVNLEQAREKLLVRCLCDENGVRMFKDNDLDLVGTIGAKNLDLLFEVAQTINGIGEKDIKELTQGLEIPQADDSHSS